jgi:HTH-type transcriptional regulator/antitoxin HigA
MEIRPIHTKEDHAAALAQIESLWDAEPGTPEHDTLENLGTLVSAYEDIHWPIEAADPIDAIRLRMEEAGYKQSDLAVLLGSSSRASEVLNRKRALTMDMAWKLHWEWKIPAEALLRQSQTAA